MKVQFWGTQGSLPASMNANDIRRRILRALEYAVDEDISTKQARNHLVDEKLPFWVRGTYGTNTTCLQLHNPGGDYLICDAGSGLRDLGLYLRETGAAMQPSTYHLFMTHLHWDHLQGFPFFVPAFIPGNQIIIHTYHPEAEDAFRQQMNAPVFPVPFDALAADITFDVQPPCTPYAIGGFQVTAIEQYHPGKSYGYRFEHLGRSVVFSTDSEHKKDAYQDNYPFIDFFRDTDLLIFDAQYTMADATFSKADWGHSSNVMGVELAARAGARRLALCHHEPTRDDEALDEFLHHTRLYRDIFHQERAHELAQPMQPQEIMLAYDGLIVDL